MLVRSCDVSLLTWCMLYGVAQLFELVTNPAASDGEEAEDGAEDLDIWDGLPSLLRLLSFCSKNFKSEMVRDALCTGSIDSGKLDCINGSCPRCGFRTLWSQGLRPYVLDANGDLRSDAPVEFQSHLKWTRISSSTTNAATPADSKQLLHQQRCGTVVEFLNEFELHVMHKFPHHKYTINKQKASTAQFLRNVSPGWLWFNVDFAENGDIITAREVQSEYWVMKHYTLFVQVVAFLLTSAWVSRDSALALRDAVTVEPAEASTPGATEPAEGSYWAEIVTLPKLSPTDADGGAQTSDETAADADAAMPMQAAADTAATACTLVYGVLPFGSEPTAPAIEVQRQYLRHRKVHTKAFLHISDDRKHDSWAAQHFINKSLQILKERYIDTGVERFMALHIHSDNASSHFKSSKTMYYVSTLLAKCASWTVGLSTATGAALPFRVFWEFGAPGHGKGVWDGLGALAKRTVRQDIIDDRPGHKTILTRSGVIATEAEVAEHLRARFQTQAWVDAHLHKTVNEIVVTYSDSTDIQSARPAVEPKYATLEGMKKTFLFMALREDVVGQRAFGCWCSACMRAIGPGHGTMDTLLRCHGCSSPQLEWRERTVEREDAAGVANARRATRAHARSLRDQLKTAMQRECQHGIWVAVQNRGVEEDKDQYWIARAMRIVKVHTEKGSVHDTNGRVRYDPGDMEIEVIWYERDVSGGDERRTFIQRGAGDDAMEGADERLHTVNSTELRHIFVKMEPVVPLGPPLQTVATRLARVPRQPTRFGQFIRGVTRVVHQQRALPPLQMWTIPVSEENLILSYCCP